MAKITSIDILNEQSLETLKEKFFNQFKSVKYVFDLFELIEASALFRWLVEQFNTEFSLNEIKEIFDYEDEDT